MPTWTMKTLLDILDDYTRHRLAVGMAGVTVDGERRFLEKFIRWLNANYGVETAERLRRRHLHAYQQHLADYRTVKGLPRKPGSTNAVISVVRNLLGYLHRQSYCINLTDAIVPIKTPEMLPVSVLEHSEIRRLLRQTDTTTAMGFRDRTVLELLYSCGIRRAELLGLKLNDVDLQKATMRITGKGSKERVVPIGRTARRYLEAYIKAIRPFWKKNTKTDAVFMSGTGNPLEKGGIRRIVNRAFADASVRTTPHTFRRSCTTEMIRSNANLYHVKELLGHATLETLKAYTKLTISDLRKTHAKCHPRERDEKRERG